MNWKVYNRIKCTHIHTKSKAVIIQPAHIIESLPTSPLTAPVEVRKSVGSVYIHLLVVYCARCVVYGHLDVAVSILRCLRKLMNVSTSIFYPTLSPPTHSRPFTTQDVLSVIETKKKITLSTKITRYHLQQTTKQLTHQEPQHSIEIRLG